MWTAFPSSDYYKGSAPHHVLPRSPRIACFCRRTRCGSHVPVFNPWMVRRLLYPWRPWRETKRSRSLPGAGLFAPSRQDGKPYPDHTAVTLPLHHATKGGIT
jgi:hypothetical protein